MTERMDKNHRAMPLTNNEHGVRISSQLTDVAGYSAPCRGDVRLEEKLNWKSMTKLEIKP